MQIKGAKYMDYGKSWADRLSENPKPDGLNAETRYWIDDMYLLTTLKLEAYRRRGTRSVWTATRRTATIC
jgi:unsaturated rhamnogalacturonyl hydrolase